MYIDKIRTKLGITVNEEYLPELLIEEFPENCFFIDSLPKSIGTNRKKFDQTEDIFYLDLKNKIKNIIIKLWMYNDVYFESSLLFNPHTLLKINDKYPLLKQEYQKIIRTIKNTPDKKIEELNQLTFLIELAHQDLIDITFFFEGYRLVLVPSWSCYFTFIQVLDNVDLIERIINVEGLYLRKYNYIKETSTQ